MEPKLSQSSLPPNLKHIVFKSSAFVSKNSTIFSQRCMLHLIRISWKSQIVTKKLLIHVVTEGETWSANSKRCGLPIVDMASGDKEVADIDRVSVVEVQHLDIRSSVTKYAMHNFEGSKWIRDKVFTHAQALELHARRWKGLFTETSTNHLHIAKTTGSFLVLVPLIAFCIKFITAAIQNRVSGALRNQQVQKPEIRAFGSKSMRWRSALSDLLDPDAMNDEHQPDSDNLSNNEDQSHIHDNSNAYAKLEDDYQKFLSECRISNWGYWRGGSPK